jgi:predicted nucleotidyltransferase
MKATGEYIELLRSFKESHADDYGINRMGIFGSVARGEHTEASDVDICVEAPSMGLLSLSGLYIKLEELLGVSVDVVRMHNNMNPRLKQRIEKDIIYV